MTNAEIIYKTSERLVMEGVLKMVQIGNDLVPEPLHTFTGWKERGYAVKKGEKSFIKIPIWKHRSKKVEKDGEEHETSSMFITTAAFFTFAQVEKIN